MNDLKNIKFVIPPNGMATIQFDGVYCGFLSVRYSYIAGMFCAYISGYGNGSLRQQNTTLASNLESGGLEMSYSESSEAMIITNHVNANANIALMLQDGIINRITIE